MALFPILIFVGCYIVWYFIGLAKTNLRHLTKQRAISSLVIVLFLVHPDIVQYMFSVFNCYNVDGESRIFENLAILCEGHYYNIFSLGVGLPGIIIWGLGIPFFAYVLLTTEKGRLNTVAVREKYGFLYRGYKKEFYYWETIIMYRKIVLIFVQVFIQ